MLELLGALGGLAGKAIDMFNAHRAAKFNPVAKRVKDAQAAGVHPLYALGASNLDSPPAQVMFGDTMAKMGQSIADANKQQTGGSKMLSGLVLEKAGLENELLRTQIQKMKGEGAAAVPTIAGMGDKQAVVGQPATSTEVAGTVITLPGGHKLNDPQYIPQLRFGLPYRTNPNFSDAQTLEDRYGDFWGSVLGTGPLAGDAWHNYKKVEPLMKLWDRDHPLNNQTDYWDMFKRWWYRREGTGGNTEVGRRR